MKINHTITQYAIGLGALVLATNANVSPAPVSTDAAVVHEAKKPSRFDWDGLGMDKTIAFGEALKGVKPGKVTIYCQNASCQALTRDLDDAFQLADWRDDLQSLPVESQEDRGIFVGPPGEDAEIFAAALLKATGLEAKIVGITDERGANIDGVGIIIGKVSR